MYSLLAMNLPLADTKVIQVCATLPVNLGTASSPDRLSRLPIDLNKKCIQDTVFHFAHKESILSVNEKKLRLTNDHHRYFINCLVRDKSKMDFCRINHWHVYPIPTCSMLFQVVLCAPIVHCICLQWSRCVLNGHGKMGCLFGIVPVSRGYCSGRCSDVVRMFRGNVRVHSGEMRTKSEQSQ